MSRELVLVGAFPFPLPFGSQVLAGGMARALAARGHRVRLATYGHGEGVWPAGVERVPVPGIPGVGVLRSGPSVDRPLQDLVLTWALARSLRARPAELLVAHHVEAVGVVRAAARLAGCVAPVLYVCHAALATELPAWAPRRMAPLAAWIGGAVDRVAVRAASGSLALSPAGEAHLGEAGAERVWRVPPGVEPDEVRGGDPARARARWALDPRPWVLYAGNLDRYQDLDVLVDALAQLPDVGLLVLTRDAAEGVPAGLPPERLRVVRDEGLDDLRDALAVASLAAVPRRVCPGFPMKILNALAAGVPVVCAEGSAPGVEGVLPVAGGDPRALAGAIAGALASPAMSTRLGEAGARAIRARWSWSARAAELEAIVAALAP